MRHSAAIMLTRGLGAELEVFLVERAPELRFFGGYWALPGGVVDAVDHRDEQQVTPETSARAALRELFEETGVLPAALHAAIPEERRAALRAQLSQRDADARPWSEFAALVDESLHELRLITSFTTPRFAAVRHTTPFYHMHLPQGQLPVVQRGELVDGRFFRPTELLDAWRRGERPVAAPVLFLLQMLKDGDLEAFHERAAAAGDAVGDGQLHRARFSPGVMIAPLLTPTLPPALTTNAIFVGEERVYLVDPATYEAGERARLYETMDRWIAAGRRFEGILLTHHHDDHIGAVGETSRRYQLPVLAHAETFKRIEPDFANSVELKHGDALELGHSPDGRAGWRLHIHHTPGHAPGHLAFIEDRYRAAIVGDMVSTLSTIVIDPPEGHMATYLASLRHLRDADIGTLYPAHGPAQLHGKQLLEHYLDHRQKRENKLIDAMDEGLATLDELLEAVYDDAPEELRPVAARSLLAGLIKLAEEGHSRAKSLLGDLAS